MMVVRSETHGNKNYKMNVICWQCGKPRHVRKNCRGGDTSQKNDSDRIRVSLSLWETMIFYEKKCDKYPHSITA